MSADAAGDAATVMDVQGRTPNLDRQGRTLRIHTVAGAIVGTILLAATGTTSATAAPTSDVEQFEAFVDTLGLASTVEAAVSDQFAQLPPSGQESILDAIETAPFSLLEVNDTATSHTLTPVHSDSSLPRQFTATDAREITILGVYAGTFTLQYTFETDGTRVTRSVDCRGRVIGFAGWSAAASYAFIGNGLGTCTAQHRLSIVHNGGSVVSQKQHQLTYNGTPALSASRLITN